jgi:deoxyribonuclease-4
MPRIGAHMSIAGGLPRAVERAALHGCESLQIFTKSPGQWRARALPPGEVEAFRAKVRELRIDPVVAHASYLINLAAFQESLRQQSIDALLEELDRADALGLMGLVVHPGACTGGTEVDGLARIAASLDTVLRRRSKGALILLEHTAGHGTSLGWTFEQLAAILGSVDGSARLGVWLDTCHLLAAGYDIVSEAGYRDTFRHFGQTIGFDRLRGFHMNDSRKPLGSRIDRHAHIGQGCLGLEPFARILRDRRFARLPMILETAKVERSGRDRVTLDPLDVRNLETLRTLRGQQGPKRPKPGAKEK